MTPIPAKGSVKSNEDHEEPGLELAQRTLDSEHFDTFSRVVSVQRSLSIKSSDEEQGDEIYNREPQQVEFIEDRDISLAVLPNGQVLNEKWDKSNHYLTFYELKSVVWLAVPCFLSCLLEILPQTVSIIQVGHIESQETEVFIVAMTLATMFLSVTGSSTALGLITALDTLCSQAYGAGQSKRMGMHIQTGGWVLSILFIFIFFANFYCGSILLWLGQPAVVSKYAGIYARYLLPGAPFSYFYEMLKKTLVAQNIAAPMVYVALISNAITCALGYYLCYFTPLSFLGAAIARSVASICSPILLLIYMRWRGLLSDIWTGFQPKNAFLGVRLFLSLGIPGMLQLCFDWWAFEIVTLLCGILPKDPILAIGANAICRSLLSMSYRVYTGISLAGNVRIGNALGEGLLQRAKLVPKIMMSLSLISSLSCALILLGFRTQLAAVYTSDSDMRELVGNLIYLLAPFQVGVAINCTIQGIFKGTGRQDLGAKLNFLSYYVVGLPIGILLACLTFLGALGLWIGLTVGVYMVAVGGCFLVAKIDWDKLGVEATHRKGSHIIHAPSSNEPIPDKGLLA